MCALASTRTLIYIALLEICCSHARNIFRNLLRQVRSFPTSLNCYFVHLVSFPQVSPERTQIYICCSIQSLYFGRLIDIRMYGFEYIITEVQEHPAKSEEDYEQMRR